MSPLITPEALAASRDALIVDCRFSLTDSEAGRRSYAEGHIPGARYADLERDLSSPRVPGGAGGRHPLPARETLCERLRALGIGKGSSVVAYDQNAGAVAGRLWWLLRWLGHADVRVLDGGIDAWLAAGFGTETAEPAPARGDLEPGPPLTRLRAADDLPDSTIALLDARDAARFRGESEPFDPVAGHIPGAISAPFTDNIEGGRFRSADALRRRFTALGVDAARETVCYCGSGVTATHNILALLVAGFPEPALYAGSWSDWIADADRPVATG